MSREGHAQYVRVWASARVERGECVRCTEPIESGGYCAGCKEYQRQAQADLRRGRNERGLCAQCGKEKRLAMRTMGEKCKSRAANRYATRLMTRKTI